jgi:MFS superfamily sulfate permease-like transporter
MGHNLCRYGTVGDLASIAGALPNFHLPGVPWDLSTLAVVAPVAASVAAVGLIETLAGRCTLNSVDP